MPLPKPPVGFVFDDHGRVMMASAAAKRIVTILMDRLILLECFVRRVFRSSKGDECMLLCPVDTPVQILKSTNIHGRSTMKKLSPFFHLLLMLLPKYICILSIVGMMDGAHYMIYTRFDPLLFVVAKYHNGVLQIADDDLLVDPAITSSIDEETEFNALVEEEDALLESLKLGEK